MKDKKKKIFLLLLIGTEFNRNKGFTIVELLVVTLIISFLFGVLFFVLNVGQVSQKVSLERVYLEAELRRFMDCISKDIRQTTAYNIKENSPNSGYIKFKKVTDVNTSGADSPLLFSDDYIEYIYSSDGGSMIRRMIYSNGTNQTLFFNTTLIQAPFYTYNSTDDIVPLNENDLLNSKKILVNLTAQRNIKNQTINCSLIQEIAIRNN